MATLQDHHRKNFMEVNKRLGLSPDEHMLMASHTAFENERGLFDAGQASGHIVSKSIEVASIAELKRLLGLPNEGGDDHVNYPDPLDAFTGTNHVSLTGDGISNEMKGQITKAATAYVLGNPEKVKEYEDLINTHMFPGKALVFSVEDLYIRSGQVLTLGTSGENEIYNIGTITVERGGEIRVEGNTTLHCQIFTQL